jgi:hypothetical protein
MKVSLREKSESFLFDRQLNNRIISVPFLDSES